ncbi:hypothetical protein RRG08_052920, partial [Elysia crispata]
VTAVCSPNGVPVDLAPATHCRSHSKKYPETFGTEDRPAYSKTLGVHLEVLGGLHQALPIFRVLNRVSNRKLSIEAISIAPVKYGNLTTLQTAAKTSCPDLHLGGRSNTIVKQLGSVSEVVPGPSCSQYTASIL